MISGARDSELVVADLMTLEPVVVQVTAGIEQAEALMHDRAVSGLPVVDELGDLVGVISRTDVVEDGSIPMAMLLRRRPSGLRVGELMTSPALTVPLTGTIREAARSMVDLRVHRLVATDDDGRPVGVLSALDLVTLFLEA